MKAYAPYTNDLRRLLLHRRGEALFPQLSELAVNGQASARLSKLVSASALKRTGAFFSSSDLSERAAASSLGSAEGAMHVADPACGAGNLLIAAAKRLPMEHSLSATLQLWGQHLAGFDVHSEFIRVAHLRLAILALWRGAQFDFKPGQRIARFFPNIRRGDGPRELRRLEEVTHVLVNPPFGPVTTPNKCAWADGKVTKAAIFFEQCLKALPVGTHVAGILPDVLRAGSRYQRWREIIEKRAEVRRISPVGNFESADVDVFLLDLKASDGNSAPTLNGRWWPEANGGDTVANHFHVHVGSVVPHRLKENEGPVFPFLHAKGLPFWGVYRPGHEKVAFAGTAVRPPFVAVRRTSSPSDQHRAIGTIITGSEPVAIENHLIVCIPKRAASATCERLLKTLQRASTNTFLNQRIRCRHLTVAAVKEIPW